MPGRPLHTDHRPTASRVVAGVQGRRLLLLGLLPCAPTLGRIGAGNGFLRGTQGSGPRPGSTLEYPGVCKISVGVSPIPAFEACLWPHPR